MQAGINPSDACLWRRRGHTLVELLGATAIASLLVMIVAQFYLATNSAISVLYAEATLQMQMTSAQRYILADVRASRLLPNTPAPSDPPYPAGETILDWGPLPTRLILRMSLLDENGEPFTDPTGKVDAIKYNYDPTTRQLTRVVAPYTGVSFRPASSKVVANYLDSVTFAWEPTPGTPDHVHCDFTGSYQGSRGPRYLYQLGFRVRPRT